MDDANGTLQALQSARGAHDLNRCELSGVLSRPPGPAPTGMGCELKVRLPGDKVLFVHLDISYAHARLLAGLAPETRLAVRGKLTYSRGLQQVIVTVDALRIEG
jgi:hypothetical protein